MYMATTVFPNNNNADYKLVVNFSKLFDHSLVHFFQMEIISGNYFWPFLQNISKNTFFLVLVVKVYY